MDLLSFISCSGLNLHYEEHLADNPAIVFVHGSSMSGKVWEKQLQSSELQMYHLLTIDLPGHGGSPFSSSPSDDYNLPAYASLLNEFIRFKQLEHYFLVGLSLGGNIIIEALPNLLPAPAGIVLVSTAIVGSPADIGDAFLDNPAVTTVFSEQPEQYEVEKLIKAYFEKDYKNVPDFFSDDFFKTDARSRSSLAKSVASGIFVDEIQVLEHTSVPVALAYGAQDQLSNISYFEQLEIAKWQNKVNLLPNAGHMPQWEASESFNQMLLDFIIDVSL